MWRAVKRLERQGI